MKILFSDNTLWGLLNFRIGIITHLLSRGHQVVLVAPRDDMSDSMEIPENLKYIPVELTRTGMNPLDDAKYYRQLKKIYMMENPDYIFHYTIKPNIYGTLAAKSLGIRSSAMIAGLGHAYTDKGVGNLIARTMYKYAMRYPEKVLVLNDANRDTLLERKVVDAGKLILMEGGEGIDTQQFEVLDFPDNEKPVFLMICRVLFEKGYAEYVETARRLSSVAEFRLMGPIDSHPSAVEREIVEADVASGVIKYIEYSPSVAEQLRQACCIVLPSYHEGLSRVLMEALAFGRPIICSDIPGCRETVREGVNGFLCQPKNADSLTGACSEFISLTRQQMALMGIEGRKLAENIFDVQNTYSIYDKILM